MYTNKKKHLGRYIVTFRKKLSLEGVVIDCHPNMFSGLYTFFTVLI